MKNVMLHIVLLMFLLLGAEAWAGCSARQAYPKYPGTNISKCEKQCVGKACGPDGCGGVCGACSGEDQNPPAAWCSPDQTHCCDCGGRECGPDSCGQGDGNMCGTCREIFDCKDLPQCTPELEGAKGCTQEQTATETYYVEEDCFNSTLKKWEKCQVPKTRDVTTTVPLRCCVGSVEYYPNLAMTACERSAGQKRACSPQGTCVNATD